MQTKLTWLGCDCPADRPVLPFHPPDLAILHRDVSLEHAAARCDLSSKLAFLGDQFGHDFSPFIYQPTHPKELCQRGTAEDCRNGY